MIPRTKEQYIRKIVMRLCYRASPRSPIDRPRKLTEFQKYAMRVIRHNTPGFVEWYQRIYQCGVTFKNTMGSWNQ